MENTKFHNKVKILVTGAGGMLVTDSTELSEEAKAFRFYGSGKAKTTFVNLGRHMVLPEISAILGIYQLKRAEEFIAKRNRIAKIYDEELNRLDLVKTIECPYGNRSSYYKYPLILDAHVGKARFTQLLEKEYAVETGNVFYPPCHMQSVYGARGADLSGKKLPVSERVLSQTITLPMHAALTDEDAQYVVKSCRAALASL